MSALATLKARYLRAREKRVVRWAIDAVVLLVLFAGLSAWQTRRHLKDIPAPPVSLSKLGGGVASLAELKGKPAMVVFWAPWCGVCKTDSDNVSRVQRWVGASANVVSIVTAFNALSEVEGYVKDQGVDYPVLLGGDAEVAAFRVNAFPTVYFLDSEGRVKGSAEGYVTTLGMLWRLLL